MYQFGQARADEESLKERLLRKDEEDIKAKGREQLGRVFAGEGKTLAIEEYRIYFLRSNIVIAVSVVLVLVLVLPLSLCKITLVL